jgi:hypothetical protein
MRSPNDVTGRDEKWNLVPNLAGFTYSRLKLLVRVVGWKPLVKKINVDKLGKNTVM